jgi:hypothetical protein
MKVIVAGRLSKLAKDRDETGLDSQERVFHDGCYAFFAGFTLAEKTSVQRVPWEDVKQKSPPGGPVFRGDFLRVLGRVR